LKFQVIECKSPDLNWEFDSSQPSYKIKTGEWFRTERVDPFPAYAHDPKLIATEMRKATAAFPIEFKVKVFSMDREVLGRTNAHASWENDWDKQKGKTNRTPFFPYIVMSGKRIPPHPAMTRYLAAHEYGHIVEGLDQILPRPAGIRQHFPYEEYEELRKVKPTQKLWWRMARERRRSVCERLQDLGLQRRDRVLAASRREAPGGRSQSRQMVEARGRHLPV
jgi:hypothetical protein